MELFIQKFLYDPKYRFCDSIKDMEPRQRAWCDNISYSNSKSDPGYKVVALFKD